jgi:hypothetical protein
LFWNDFVMWDRSYRWQHQVRLIAGGVVVVSLLIGAGLLANTSAAGRTRVGAQDLAREIFLPNQQIIEVRVPASLLSRAGALVFREREDGIAQVVGRVVEVKSAAKDEDLLTIRLSANSAAVSHEGGTIKGAPAALSMRDAVRLLVSPDTPEQEALVARDAIWPSIRANLVPEIMNGMIREISSDLANPNSEDAELLKRFATSLRTAMEPLEEQLVERLARRAWDVVGVQGLAGGALKVTSGSALGLAKSIAAWWSWFQGNEADKGAPERPFLSPEMSQALKVALEEEVLAFWADNRAQIIEAFKKSVSAQRADFDKAFTERWSGRLYERVIEPAWQSHQAEVISSIETYVRDFSQRRLLTREGGPRLLFAFLLRSYLDISSAPLLILAPNSGGDSDRFVYQPLL